MFRQLFLFLLIIPSILFGQSNYKKATLITAKGDTLNGYINYKEWHQNPSSIFFKQFSEEANIQTFTTDNTTSFSITGYESYASYTVSISTDEIRFRNLTEQADTGTITKKVFLKEILKGDRVNLFSYKDKIKGRYYILKNRETTPKELLLIKTLKEQQANTQEIFKQQLVSLAIEYGIYSDDLNHKIQNTYYSEDDLKRVLSRFNTINDVQATTGMAKKKIRTFVGIGMASMKLNYTGPSWVTIDRLTDNGTDKYKEEVTTPNVSPRFSGGIEFYFNPEIRRTTIRMEVSAFHIKSTTKSYYRYNSVTDDENENTYKLEAWNFSLTPQLLHNIYNTEKFKSYLGVGIAFNYLHQTENSLEKKRMNQPYSEVTVDNKYFTFKPTNLSVQARLGVQVKQRYDLSLLCGNHTEYILSSTSSLRGALLAFSFAYFLNK